MKKIIIIFLLSTVHCLSQTFKDSLFIEYDKFMRINNSKDTFNETEVKLSFTIGGDKSGKTTTYNFLVDNIKSNFKYRKFEEIKDTITNEFIEKIKPSKLADLSKLSACDLFLLLADTKNIYLIKKESSIYYRYKLLYLSTQRGWEYARTD